MMKPCARLAVVALVTVSLCSSVLAAQSIPVGTFEAPTREIQTRSVFAAGDELSPAAILQPAMVTAIDGIESVRIWNEAGRLPTRNGFARALPLPETLRLSSEDRSLSFQSRAGGVLSTRPDGSQSWMTRIRVENAYRLRAHLTSVSASTPLLFWIHSANGESVGPFGKELVSGGELWTPSIGGEELTLEVRIPEDALVEESRALFTIDRVLEIVRLDEAGRPTTAEKKENTQCLADAACFNSSDFAGYDAAITAVAHMQFVDDNQGAICTGTLMNDNDDASFIPYFLTANHCISGQSAASTLESFFDYRAKSCLGNAPALGTLPRVTGSALVATSVLTDFTLLVLTSLPPRAGFLMGWSSFASESAPGKTLYRISHPLGFSQGYSETTVPQTVAGLCSPDEDGRPWDDLNRFVYQDKKVGAVLGGSSGGSAMNANGQIVGQLLGGCGLDLDNSCSLQHQTVDGRFSATFPFVQPFIFGTSMTPCIASATTTCQVNNRFELTTTYDLGNGQTGSLGLNAYTNNSTLGHFFNPSNVEVLAKVLDGCGINDFYWVAIAGLTNREVVIQVRDTTSGVTKVYSNPLGTLFQTKFDTEAFPCN